MVPDDAAGHTYTCQTCGHSGVIPNESSPDCILVFRNGYPNEGMALDISDFQSLLDDGTLNGSDLIFHEGTWVPIDFVYETPPLPQPPPPTGEEIAIQLSELPPMPGFDKPGQVHPMQVLKNLYAHIMEWQRRQRSVKYKSGKQKAIYYILVAIVLFISYFMGLGKVINYIRWKPAYVVVFNPDDTDYIATLCGQKQTIPAKSSGTFQDLFVSTSCTRKLTFINPGDNSSAYSVKVPVKPGRDILVNPLSKLEFHVYDITDAEKIHLKKEYADHLHEELSTGNAPNTLLRVSDYLHTSAEQFFKCSTSDPVYESTSYNLSKCGLVRSADFSQRLQNTKVKQDTQLPILIHGAANIKFSGASINYTHSQKNCTCNFAISIKKPIVPFKPENFAATKGKVVVGPIQSANMNFSMTNNGQSINFECSTPLDAKVTCGKEEYKGAWRYSASQQLTGTDKHKWKWSWYYSGTYTNKSGKTTTSKSLSLSVTTGYDGKTTVAKSPK